MGWHCTFWKENTIRSTERNYKVHYKKESDWWMEANNKQKLCDVLDIYTECWSYAITINEFRCRFLLKIIRIVTCRITFLSSYIRKDILTKVYELSESSRIIAKKVNMQLIIYMLLIIVLINANQLYYLENSMRKSKK